MTYTQAVEKACNGDSTGFEFLYDTTKNNKYYLALKYVKDEEAAKDVLQRNCRRGDTSFTVLHQCRYCCIC